MFFMPPNQIKELCKFAYLADKEARSDLVGGYIIGENDYTSNFTGGLRRIINSNSRTGLTASSHLLSPPDERLSGCDASIVITSNDYFKIVTFEAKFPRISQPYYSWDYAQTSAGLSHYSDQLERQKGFAGQHAIFEMFYCELPFGKQPTFMQNEVSSCVWHEDAVKYDNSRKTPKQVWNHRDIVGLLNAGNHSIDHMLREVCICSRGKPSKSFGDVPAIAREFSLYGSLLHISAQESSLTEPQTGLDK
jgi:hypothetical protein